MIDLTVIEERLARAVKSAKERDIIIPTYAQMKDPGLIPEKFKNEIRKIGLWDLEPRNLFRISWKNEPTPLECPIISTTMGGYSYMTEANKLAFSDICMDF